MSDRDELADLIRDTVFDPQRGTSTWEAIADAILAAGWRPPDPCQPCPDCEAHLGHGGGHYAWCTTTYGADDE